MSVFMLEIGTEELPARFLPALEQELVTRFSGALDHAGIDYVRIEASSTPRRLVLHVEDMDRIQRDSEEVISGPPLRIAYDGDGAPTKAALGFAHTQGVDMEALFTLSTDKGDYIAVRKKSGGRLVCNILAELCPEIIAGLPFPKKMRWGSGEFTFGRPLRWLLAIFDADVVPFSLGGLTSGRLTHGHRVHGPGPFEVSCVDAYTAILRTQCGVTLFSGERRNAIIQGGNALAAGVGGSVLWKESLLDEVQGLCEHPTPCLGCFEPDFLELPAQVLLTSMESHQKSFGVAKDDGALLPYFLTILNVTPKDNALVQKGWERVLRARLEDARFFWRADIASDFATWLDKLEAVIFLAPLGSMGDKTRRLEALCRHLATLVEGADAEEAARAGRLSKADLVSEMVCEFDSLQGVMGGIYAQKKGESETVATAIGEQYLATGPESPLPVSLHGALLSLADKLDTLVGCFGLGMMPTGASDPYALRRCALGIVRIIFEKKLRLGIGDLFEYAQQLYGQRQWKIAPAQAQEAFHEFFALRLKNFFVSKGYETLFIEAVLSAGLEDVWAVGARLDALTTFGRSVEFEAAILTFKRAANIIRKQGQETGIILDGVYNDGLFEDDAERALADVLRKSAADFEAKWAACDYQALFLQLNMLRPVVDAFFENVMVMCDDAALRNNRLNLLQALVGRLGRLADFNALQM